MQLMWLSGPTGQVKSISITAKTVLRGAFALALGLMLLGFFLNWIGLRFAVEYNPDLVVLSRRAATLAGVSDKATFSQGDMFEADISKATVMPLFLLPNHLNTLAAKFLRLKPGARVVSNTYEIGGGWEPDESVRTEPCLSWCIAHLYVVPAQVAGAWRLAEGETLFLEQHYQRIYGAYQIDNVAVTIDNGRLRGEEISFTVNNVVYRGRISGDAMAGTAKGRVTRDWRAVRMRESNE